MIDFNKIKNVKIPKSVLLVTEDALRYAGGKKCEAFILWAGTIKNEIEFHITRAILPEQVCYKSHLGMGVQIHSDELFRISKELYQKSELSIAQVHSHPGEAYHSEADDDIPLVTALGQFSLVIPFFCKDGLKNFLHIKFFRLFENGWTELTSKEIDSIFEVV